MKRKKLQKGFTLIETLIAVMVLMLAITGPLTLAQKGLQATIVAKDQDTAFYLAQDAMEYVRWVRDTNRLRGRKWLAGLDGTANGHTNLAGAGGLCTSQTGTQSCLIDSLKDTTTSCGAATCSMAIRFDPTNNYFSYTTGTASLFTRTVKIASSTCSGTPCNPNEAVVTVTISWYDQGSLLRSVTVRESLFDWE